MMPLRSFLIPANARLGSLITTTAVCEERLPKREKGGGESQTRGLGKSLGVGFGKELLLLKNALLPSHSTPLKAQSHSARDWLQINFAFLTRVSSA